MPDDLHKPIYSDVLRTYAAPTSGCSNPITGFRVVVTDEASYYARNHTVGQFDVLDYETARESAKAMFGPMNDYRLEAIHQSEDDDA